MLIGTRPAHGLTARLRLRLRVRFASLEFRGSVKCRICPHSSVHPIDPLVGVRLYLYGQEIVYQPL